MTQFVCNPLFHLGVSKVAEIWCPMYPGSGSYAGNVERCVDNRLPRLIPQTKMAFKLPVDAYNQKL